MKTIKLGFTPDEVEEKSEAFYAFKYGGLALKFWILYKSNHITDQHIASAVKRMGKKLKKGFKFENIDEFYWFARRCGFPVTSKWLAKNWDFFSPRINRDIEIVYKEMKVCEVSHGLNGRVAI